ncbi:hypothetical protein I4F81_002081 [Pyropia yezoensis]|uniref:Uncharacterized protein n=1 Tax=Pyropia yezoensis TaxID=2788 RepID=A0ACC3BNE0_PYRYE|nr:hypothetical protein I4F81_002081 [Neopyropia yezoensis]
MSHKRRRRAHARPPHLLPRARARVPPPARRNDGGERRPRAADGLPRAGCPLPPSHPPPVVDRSTAVAFVHFRCVRVAVGGGGGCSRGGRTPPPPCARPRRTSLGLPAALFNCHSRSPPPRLTTPSHTQHRRPTTTTPSPPHCHHHRTATTTAPPPPPHYHHHKPHSAVPVPSGTSHALVTACGRGRRGGLLGCWGTGAG